jgi:hypothetical protein
VRVQRWVCCALVLPTVGCFHPVYDNVRCGRDGSCPGGVACNLSGFCETPGSGLPCGPGNTCPEGQECSVQGFCGPSGVGGGHDAGFDAAGGGGPFCYGTAPFSVCFATAPTGAIDVAAPTTFDTGIGSGGTQLTCSNPLSGGTGYCVLAAGTITIGSQLSAVGTRPLVLVAADSIDVIGTLDVASHRAPMESIGAGADPIGCSAGTLPATSSGTSGGGAGGSFIGKGGNGGNGGGASGGTGGARGNAVSLGTVLRGGCPGQDGAGTGKGARGHGGGAVYMIAGRAITVHGGINAGGEGGAGGIGSNNGGGGGGAGGLIGFDAPTTIFMATGVVIANGGGGGEGGGSSGANGAPGFDSDSNTAVSGGSGGSSAGGDGGDGSAGAVGGPGVIGQDGSAANGGGGGGGGGGAGIIKGPPALLSGANVSPAATP